MKKIGEDDFITILFYLRMCFDVVMFPPLDCRLPWIFFA